MPVFGRPTNAALLKITHGSSGPRTNPFQNIRIGAGAEIAPAALAADTSDSRCVHKSHPIIASAAINAKLITGTRNRLFADAAEPSSESLAQVPAALPFPWALAAVARSWNATA